MQIRFTARGNLVVVPKALTGQWQLEIQQRCTREQIVLVLDSPAERKRLKGSVEGMREVAEADWVITSPDLLLRDLVRPSVLMALEQ
jgi:hypothetical protein